MRFLLNITSRSAWPTSRSSRSRWCHPGCASCPATSGSGR